MRDLSKYIGVPFLNNGRHLDRGCDCWGLVRLIWKNEFGFTVPSHLGIYDVNDDPSMDKSIQAHWDEKEWVQIEPGLEQPGDGVLMRLAGLPIHIGIVAGEGKMIHTFVGANSALENYRSTRWEKRIAGFWRHV